MLIIYDIRRLVKYMKIVKKKEMLIIYKMNSKITELKNVFAEVFCDDYFCCRATVNGYIQSAASSKISGAQDSF